MERGRGRLRKTLIKQVCTDISKQTYLELKRAARDRGQLYGSFTTSQVTGILTLDDD